MATTDTKTPQKFSVPGPFYWSVRGVHAAAPLFVGLGNLESRMLAKSLASQRVDRPLYICGLPRAGTTITLQMLSEHPDVVTHKYADFLMPYMPYVWNKVFPKIPVDAMRKPVPRIHRDRIEVTRDSAEMGEEILWEHFFPHIHDESNYSVLDATTSNPAFERFYEEHLCVSSRWCGAAAGTSARRSCAWCACSICAGSSRTPAFCSTCVIRSTTSRR